MHNEEIILYDPGNKHRYNEATAWLIANKTVWEHYGKQFGTYHINIYFTNDQTRILFDLKFL